jgi:hypothetical protein
MRRFYKYILFVLVGLALLDVINRIAFSYVFNHLPAHSILSDYVFSYRYNQEHADIVILGDSRARHHYDSQMFMDTFHQSCENLGHDGSPIYRQWLELLRASHNGKIKTVILDASPKPLSRLWMEEYYDNLLPFYWSEDSIHRIIDKETKNGKFSNLLYASSFVQYNSKLHHVFESFIPRSVSTKHGFDPLPYTGNAYEQSSAVPEIFITQNGVSYVDRIVEWCKKNDVRLLMVTSPYIGDHFEFVRLISDYCKNKNVTYLDYSSSKRYVDDMYLWKDEAHLNEKGAEMFSEELVRHLKRQNLLN